MLHAVERMVGDIEAEHVSLMREEHGLVPLPQRDLGGDAQASGILGLTHAAEEVELTDGLGALEIDRSVDDLLVHRDESATGVTE